MKNIFDASLPKSDKKNNEKYLLSSEKFYNIY